MKSRDQTRGPGVDEEGTKLMRAPQQKAYPKVQLDSII